VFFTVVGLTLLCGAAAVSIAIFSLEPAPPMVSEVYKTSLQLFNAGMGAVLGLLGGRSLK
jgi:hypothetical protein